MLHFHQHKFSFFCCWLFATSHIFMKLNEMRYELILGISYATFSSQVNWIYVTWIGHHKFLINWCRFKITYMYVLRTTQYALMNAFSPFLTDSINFIYPSDLNLLKFCWKKLVLLNQRCHFVFLKWIYCCFCISKPQRTSLVCAHMFQIDW